MNFMARRPAHPLLRRTDGGITDSLDVRSADE
jgi:hypothetical protein